MGLDDVGNYDCENPSSLHGETSPNMQPLHEEARPPTDKAVHSPQSDEVTTSCNGFIDLHKDVDKTFYIGCETYT